MRIQVQDTPAAALAGDAIEHAGITAGPSTSEKRAARMRKAVCAKAKGVPALEAAAEAWCVLDIQADAAYRARDEAEEIEDRAPEGAPGNAAAARRAASAERKWLRALALTEQAAEAVLKIQTTTPAEINKMADVYIAMHGGARGAAFGYDTERAKALAAVQRHLRALGSVTPPPPQPQDPRGCPVAALASAFERVVTEECAAEDAHDDDAANAAWRRREEMQARIVGLRASSIEGARLQLVFALDRACDARMSEEANRDQYVAECRELIISALAALPGQTSDVLWSYYIGGDQAQIGYAALRAFEPEPQQVAA